MDDGSKDPDHPTGDKLGPDACRGITKTMPVSGRTRLAGQYKTIHSSQRLIAVDQRTVRIVGPRSRAQQESSRCTSPGSTQRLEEGNAL